MPAIRRPVMGFVRPPRVPAEPGVVEGGIRHLHPPQAGWVRFRAVKNQELGLVAELNGVPQVVEGYGTDALVDRPGRVAISHEAGTPPLALRIPLLLDRWQQRRSVEPEVRVLEKLLGLSSTRPNRPLVVVEGRGIPHSYEQAAHLRWRLSDPEWGDDVRYVNSRDRAFVEVSVLARVAVTPDTLVETEEGVTEGKKGRMFFRTTRRVNTLRKVSTHVRVPWQQLKKLNDDLPKDPDKQLRAGTRVRID